MPPEVPVISSEIPAWKALIASAFSLDPPAKPRPTPPLSAKQRRIAAINRALFDHTYGASMRRQRRIGDAFGQLSRAAYIRDVRWPACINRFERSRARADHADALYLANLSILASCRRLP